MTDEHINLTENGVQKARSLHRKPPQERFVISDLRKVRGRPWNGRAENMKARMVTQQDQGPSGHRRVYLTTKVAARLGATPGCGGCVGLGRHTEACRVRLEKALADERERVQVQSERESDRSLSLPLSPRNQHRRHSKIQRLHHAVLLRRCRAKEVRELDQFEVKMEVVESEMRVTPSKKILVKMGGNPIGSKQRRLCVTEVNTGESRSDTFAATPPLKFVRLILS